MNRRVYCKALLALACAPILVPLLHAQPNNAVLRKGVTLAGDLSYFTTNNGSSTHLVKLVHVEAMTA